MVTDKIKELQTLKAKAAALEQEIASARNAELAGLPARYGFTSADAFVAAVRAAATSGGARRRGRKPGRVMVASSGAKVERRRGRAKITEEPRAEVKMLVGQGKTGAEIAKAVGISLPSVQNIKKALGLVQKRK